MPALPVLSCRPSTTRVSDQFAIVRQVLTFSAVYLPHYWDAEGFSALAKVFRVGGKPPKCDVRLHTAFPSPQLGCVKKPAVVVDRDGVIVLFYLPGILPKSSCVGSTAVHPYFELTRGPAGD